MSNIPLDSSRIGPLFESRIGREPVVWGKTPQFTYADAETAAYVERDIARFKTQAKQVLGEELSALVGELQTGSEPRTVLHGVLRYGDSSVARVAGYIGRTVDEVETTVQSLSFLGVLEPSGLDNYGDIQYRVDDNAEWFAA